MSRPRSTIATASRHAVVEAAHDLQAACLPDYQTDIAFDPLERIYTAWIKLEGARYIDFTCVGRTPKIAADNLRSLYPQYFRNH